MIAAAALAIAVAATPAAAQTRNFALGPAMAGAIAVPANQLYGGGYGYEPGPGRLFSVAVPPGNYRVTVTLGLPHAASVTTIKAEARRLMLDAVAVPAGATMTRSFIVNVRDPRLVPPPANAPGATAVLLKPHERDARDWDDRLTLEILGAQAAVTGVAITPVSVPTIFLLGDSTVTDQPAEPAASWGQMLPVFFRPDIAVANHAESGETLKSFMTELRLAKILETARPGDWAFIQFGHNDQKANWPQTFAPADTVFRAYLRAWIAEFRRREVTPVLVTSPDRRIWQGTHIRSTLAEYVAAVKAVGAEEHVPVIDLNAASIAIYEALGPARAPLAFNDGGRDATHHDNYGAWMLARAVVAGIAAGRLPLATHLRDDLAPFDPARPPDPATFALAASGMHDTTRPEGN